MWQLVITTEVHVDGNKKVSEGLPLEKSDDFQGTLEQHFFHKTCSGHLNLEVVILHNHRTYIIHGVFLIALNICDFVS